MAKKAYILISIGLYIEGYRMFTLGSEKHTVLRVLPSDAGVITYYFSGFGDTGMECHRVSGLMDLGQSTCDARLGAGRPHS